MRCNMSSLRIGRALPLLIDSIKVCTLDNGGNLSCVVFGVKIICNRQSSKICTSGDSMDFLCTRCDQKRLFVLPLVLNFGSGSLDQFFLLYVATARVPINSIKPFPQPLHHITTPYRTITSHVKRKGDFSLLTRGSGKEVHSPLSCTKEVTAVDRKY